MGSRVLLLLACAVLFALAASRVTFTTDTADILPSQSALRETLSAAQRFPGARLIVVDVDGTGTDRDTLTATTRDLATRLAALDTIESVRAGFTGEDGVEIRKRMAPHATGFLPVDQLREITTPDAITAKVEDQRKRLAGFGGAFLAGVVREDPLDIRGLALTQLQAQARPGARVEDGLLLDETGTRALILASTVLEASAIGPNDARVAEIATTIDASPLPTIWFGGTRMAWETASSIERDVRVTAGLGMVLLGIVLFVGFRSWRPIAGAVLPSLVAGGCATVGAWWASPVHGLQLGFSAALAGLAVDYWVHLYLAAAAIEGQSDLQSRYRAALVALRDLLPALAVSAGSTALAFALLTTSALPIVRVLGITGAAAALGAFAGSVVAGPIAWALFGRPQRSTERHAPPGWATPLAVGAVVLGLLGFTARFEPDPMALIATSPAAEAAQQSFSDRFQLTSMRGLVLLDAPTPGEALDRAHVVQRALDATGAVQASGPASLLPGPDTVVSRREALPDIPTLQARLDAAAEAAGLPRFEGAAARIHTWASPPPVGLWDGTPLSDRVTLLGTQALVTVPIADPDLTPALAAAVSAADPNAALVVPGQLATASMDQARTALVSRAALGAVAVFLLLTIRHRSPRTAVLALLPAALGIAGAAGAMALSGQPWNPVSLAAMVPVLGLAVDYGVFMTERATRTAPRAVTLSAVTTLAGFATLALARSPALFGVGIATFAGVGFAALTALVLLPAVLEHGWPRQPEGRRVTLPGRRT